MTQPKWWRVTIPRSEFLQDGRPNPYYGFTTLELGEQFEKHGAERWVLGEEKGDSGYEHWQGHIVFNKGKTLENLVMVFPLCHWTPSANHNFDYEEKEGKFVRSWEKALTPYTEWKFKEWQEDLIKKMEELRGDDRKIIFILDRQGDSGKTIFCKILVALHKAAYCPALPEALDYMAWALAHANAGTFLIDLPRAEDMKSPEKEGELWRAIEQMKNGYLYDKRHHWQEKWIEPPTIVVFGNFEPRWCSLSNDRWCAGILTGKKGHRWIQW